LGNFASSYCRYAICLHTGSTFIWRG